jgi:S1-C subfamily serine protease
LYRLILANLFVLCVSASCSTKISSCVSSPVVSSSIPVKNFIGIFNKFETDICFKVEKVNLCRVTDITTTGSGFLYRQLKNGSVFAVTARHVCFPNEYIEKVTSVRNKVTFVMSYDKKPYSYDIIASDKELDICLLKIDSIQIDRNLIVSNTTPQIGDKVFVTSAPLGFFLTRVVPIFDGYYIGNSPEDNKDYYSVFVETGSSGSMILNERFEVIGITSQKKGVLPITISPAFSPMRNYIRSHFEKLNESL